MRRVFAALVVVLALLPGRALAEERPLQRIAEDTAACMTTALDGRIIGMTWVEPTDRGYRVAMQIAYPPPWAGPVFAWLDIRPSRNARGEEGIRADYGGHYDPRFVRVAQDCVTSV